MSLGVGEGRDDRLTRWERIGRVKIARHEESHQYAAVKIVPKPKPTTETAASKTDKVR